MNDPQYNRQQSKRRFLGLFTASAALSLMAASCANHSSSTLVADTNRDGHLSDSEMTQYRRQQEVRGVKPGTQNTTGHSAVKTIRSAREVAGTANTFRYFSQWLF